MEKINKPKVPEKTKEEIKAEREAKKKAKQEAKIKGKTKNTPSTNPGSKKVGGSSLSYTPQPDQVSAVSGNESSSLQPVTTESKFSNERTPGKNAPVAPGKEEKEHTKAETKAARRLKQEAQRAAKENPKIVETTTPVINPEIKQQGVGIAAKSSAKRPEVVPNSALASTPKILHHRVKLFNHLYAEGNVSKVDALLLKSARLHPAIIRLGLQYAKKIIVGSNARCVALLSALKKVIADYRTPAHQEYARGLEARIQPGMDFLQLCRPHSVSMTNALRHVRRQMTLLKNNVSDQEATKKLHEAIDIYLREQIDVAAEAICLTMNKKISNGDVILTYGSSSLVERILVSAHASGTIFRVVVVDARPWTEGRQLLRKLTARGISCSYVLVAAASAIMREASKVLLGAHALLANGYVMSRAGSAQIALLAHSCNVPVLVCCETHKFCEQVQTDAFVYNEIGNPDDLITVDPLTNTEPLKHWREVPSLTPLNLTYDVTPSDLVSGVVTELTILPCTSVPVILRIKPSEAAERDAYVSKLNCKDG